MFIVKRYSNRCNSQLLRSSRNPSSNIKRNYFDYSARIKTMDLKQRIFLGGITIIAGLLCFIINEHNQHNHTKRELQEAKGTITKLRHESNRLKSDAEKSGLRYS